MPKLITCLLAGSLALNLALVVLLVSGAASKEQAPTPFATPHVRTPTDGAPVIDPTVWPSLNSGDLPGLVARLRAAGFPPDMLRAILSAQLQEQFVARRKAIDPAADDRPFWKRSTLDPQVQTAFRQLYRDQQKAMRELLGSDAEPDDPMNRARDLRQFGHLPPEKIETARRIVREFNELRSDLYTGFVGMMTPADRDKLTALERQQRTELAKIMTPREFEDYELRGSNTANSLRYQLAAFDATEAEFRTLFQLQRTFDERFSPMYVQPSQEEMRLRSEAQKQLNDQIKAALGSIRATDYERATNYEYRTTSQLIARLELPPDTANQIWSVRTEIQKRAEELHKNRSLAPEQRNQQLAGLQKDALTQVSPLLGGARGVDAYKQYGGQWIDSLVPRPRSTPAR